MPQFNYATTHVGSVPHPSLDGLTNRLVEMLDIPAWPQLSQRSYRENMYVMFSPTLPALVEDSEQKKIFFDTHQDLSTALETFYTPILADNVEAFALAPGYASGFFAMLESLQQTRGKWAKGQVIGPISFGLTITDRDLRASLYNETLAEVIVKNMAMAARWQVRRLKTVRSNVIIVVDEPYMASFGSAFINLSREQVVAMLDEVFEAIHTEGALAGAHCCANTDWGLLLETEVDILNLDAYGFIQNLALYPAEIRAFLDRDGCVAWGIIPNNNEIFEATPQVLADRLRNGIQLIIDKAASRGVLLKQEEFATHSLISPICGLGPATVEIAERAFEMLAELGKILKG